MRYYSKYIKYPPQGTNPNPPPSDTDAARAPPLAPAMGGAMIGVLHSVEAIEGF